MNDVDEASMSYEGPGGANRSCLVVLHVHAVLGLPDGTTRGGHLLEGQVFPTLEDVVTETPRGGAR
jgi:predicted DNA-binding protein with PD1-like motif